MSENDAVQALAFAAAFVASLVIIAVVDTLDAFIERIKERERGEQVSETSK